jgi:hypothetical protein
MTRKPHETAFTTHTYQETRESQQVPVSIDVSGSVVEVDQKSVTRLADVCAKIAATDPDGRLGTDLSTVFSPFDMTKPAEVRVSWGGSHVDASPYPQLAGLAGRREAIILITELTPLLAIVAESWDRMPSWERGAVPWPHEFLAFRSLDPPLAYFRTARKPRWLVEASGSDIQRILAASLAPVIAALKPNALGALSDRHPAANE